MVRRRAYVDSAIGVQSRFFSVTELIIVIAVIGTAAAFIVPAAVATRNYAVTVDFTGMASVARAQVSLHYALTGEWPVNDAALWSIPIVGELAGSAKESRFVKKYVVKAGAIDYHYTGGTHDGKVLTVHPAQAVGDPSAPVKWVAGTVKQTPGWAVFGPDSTTIEERYIPRELKD